MASRFLGGSGSPVALSPGVEMGGASNEDGMNMEFVVWVLA